MCHSNSGPLPVLFVIPLSKNLQRQELEKKDNISESFSDLYKYRDHLNKKPQGRRALQSSKKNENEPKEEKNKGTGSTWVDAHH